MSIVNAAPEVPTMDELRKKLETLGDEINNLTASGLGRVTAQVRDRPLSVVLVALGIGLIGGYLLKR